MEIVTYNNYQFNQEVTLFSLSPGQGIEGNSKSSDILDNKAIKKIAFISDLKTAAMIGHMEVQDIDNQVYQKYSANNQTFVKIDIGPVDDNMTMIYEFKQLFLITSLKITQKNQNDCMIRIDFIHADFLKFSNALAYSSFKEKPINKIIEEMLKNAEFRIKTIDYDFIDKEFFLTPTNYPLQESIEFLLDKTIKDNFPFLVYDPITKFGQYSVVNTKICKLDDMFKFNKFNIFYYITKQESQRNTNLLASNVDIKNHLNYYDNYLLFRPFKVKKFDYDKREYPKDYETDLSKIKKQIEHIVKPEFSINIETAPDVLPKKIKREFYTFFHQQPRNFKYFEKYLTLANVMTFTAYGNLTRYAGQTLVMNVDSESKEYQKVYGPWLITRITHEFNQDNFRNIVNAVKLESIKP